MRIRRLRLTAAATSDKTVSIKITRNDIPKLQKAVVRFAKKDAPRLAANVLRDRGTDRTLSGKDVNGKRFTKYTEEYIPVRKKQGLQIVPPNLQVTNKMIASQHYEEDAKVDLGRGPAMVVSEKENPKARGNQAKREWVGVGPGDVEAVKKELKKQAENEIRINLKL